MASEGDCQQLTLHVGLIALHYTFAKVIDIMEMFTVTWQKCLFVQIMNSRYNKLQYYAVKGRH